MFMAQCFRFGWRRCSPLNWALCALSKNKEYSIIMVGRTEAYKKGYGAKHYENPYPRNSQEYNDFERGWSQKIKSTRSDPPLKHYQKELLRQHKEQTAKPSRQASSGTSDYNYYAEAKGK
ncbi:hypothetical protein B9J84_15470 [Vibrio sp. V03_P4A6T147]|nr:hypothetical protein B9J84_15470 [Vibrio sp. V03_P4A6T147]